MATEIKEKNKLEEKKNIIKIFETTLECAKYFDKPNSYINHSLYCNDKIRKDNKWYKISRNIELCKE
mgnify:CR=1 FL=1